MHGDLLSVVIPTYNEKRELLKKAIDTVLNQTYPYIELIIIDDGCTDGTSGWIKQNYGNDVRLFRRERNTSFRTVSEAFNIGLLKATGKWWHHDAADCWHEPDWAEKCMMYLDEADEGIIGAHTNFAVHTFDGQVEAVDVKRKWNTKQSAFANYQIHEALGGMIFRMDVCRKVGLWDTRFPRKQTREWTMRVLVHGDLLHVPKVLWHFVFHEADQMKRVASVKYRVLGDLKNGWDIEHNMKIALGSKIGRYALIEALREFFTSPQWERERADGATVQMIDDALKVCNQEASESWEMSAEEQTEAIIIARKRFGVDTPEQERQKLLSASQDDRVRIMHQLRAKGVGSGPPGKGWYGDSDGHRKAANARWKK